MEKSEVMKRFQEWRAPGGYKIFAREVLRVNLDPEQEAILDSFQLNPMTSVVSGTSRGKDFISAVCAICFMYLTPYWDPVTGELIGNTKVIMTAPTARQVENIMFPEISRIFKRVGFLPGRLTGADIRTDYEEWFLTGFKADAHNTEAWTGLHAVHIAFLVTEASGIPQNIWDAIEGNLQGHSRLLLVFNANVSTGYAAQSQKSPRFHKFRLDSLNAPNVLQRKNIIPGQVDYEWVKDKVIAWCMPIPEEEYLEAEGDFRFEIDGIERLYRPNDLFRVKIRGMFPKVSEDTLIPLYWVELAQERWRKHKEQGWKNEKPLRLGVDVAGMGRDSSCFVPRYGNVVETIELVQSGGIANHMEIAGKTNSILTRNTDKFAGKYPQAFIDTIGEGAGVYSRLVELKIDGVFSVKFSASATKDDRPLKDVTNQYEFLNMRAYLFWALRDWLDPAKKSEACLPPDEDLKEELCEIKWKFLSNGKIQIEAKEDIKTRLKRSPDKADALANTFYPVPDIDPNPKAKKNKANYFF